MSYKNYIKPYCQDLNTEISTYLFEGEEQENTETEPFYKLRVFLENCESYSMGKCRLFSRNE